MKTLNLHAFPFSTSALTSLYQAICGNKGHYCFLLVLLVLQPMFPQEYPKDAFRSPLDIPIVLAGTFGELRSNHFHSGIDIKTKQRQGLPVYAIGDGTVTRIKVSLWGYGKALYVAHPNGYTSVYAHLQKFSPAIEEYVKKVQYRKKSYEVEMFPNFGELRMKKGDIIAYTGNTGGSSGPHLHFEIRNSATEWPTNPLFYGMEVLDATNPVVNSVYVYPLSEGGVVNQSQEKVKLNLTRLKDGSFLADKVAAVGSIGFGFSGFDRQDLAANRNGIYSVRQTVNGKTYTAYDFETFSFSETRYINTLIDYSHFGRYRQRVQRLFKSPNNRLSIYDELYNDGKIEVREGLSYQVEIVLADLKGNTTKIAIPVEGKKEAVRLKKEPTRTDDFVIATKPNTFDLGAAKVYFPANTFYENFFIDLKKGTDTVTIHRNTVPAHKRFTVSFDVSKYPETARKQLFIALLDDGKPKYQSTYKRGNTFTTRT
ncbi:MAG: M23 family metallopeptidase, partial [Flavobacteriaceae bacterium]